MSGYRYVSFYDLCRLCTAISENKTNIFSAEGRRKNLSMKILECLSVSVDDKDELPKVICGQCQQHLESFVEFRNICVSSQNVLNSCLRTANLQTDGKVYIKDGGPNGKNLSIVNMQATATSTNSLTTTPVVATSTNPTTKYVNDSQSATQGQDFLNSIIQAVGLQQSNDNGIGKAQVIQQYTLTIPKEDTTDSSTSNVQTLASFQSAGKQTKNNSLEEFLKMKPNLRVTPIKKIHPQKNQVEQQQIDSNQQQKQHQQLQLQQQLHQLQSQLQLNQQLTLSACGESPKSKKPKLNFVLTSPSGQTLSASLVQSNQQQTQYQTLQQPQQLQLQIQQSQQPQLQLQNKQSSVLPTATLASIIAQQQQQTNQQQNDQTLISPSKCFLPITIKDGNSDQQIVAHFDAKNFILPTTYQLQMKLQPQIATADGQPIMQLTPTSIPATLQLTPQTMAGQSFHELCNQQQPSQSHQLQFQQIIQQAEHVPQHVVTAPGGVGVDAATSTNDQEAEQENNNSDLIKIATNNAQSSQIQKVRNVSTIMTQQISTAPNNQRQKFKVLKNCKTNNLMGVPRPGNVNQQTVQQTVQQNVQQKQSQQTQQQEQQQIQKYTSVQHGGITVHRIVTKNHSANSTGRLPVLNKQNVTINRSSTSQAQQNNQTTTEVVSTVCGQKKPQLQSKRMLLTKTYTRNDLVKSAPTTKIVPTSASATTSVASINTNHTPAKNHNTIATVSSPGPGPTGLDCSQCGRVFKKKEHLTQHLKLHTGHRPFKCTETGCNKSFSRKEHLMRHIISHTGKKMFCCEMCQKLFSRKDNLNKHKRTHTHGDQMGAGNYTCEICKKTFAVKLYYEQHLKMHEKSNNQVAKTKQCIEKNSSEMFQQRQPKQIQQQEQKQQQQQPQQLSQQKSQQQQTSQHHQQSQIVQDHQQSQSTNHHQVQILQQQHPQQLLPQPQIMHLQLPMVTTQDLAGNTITITQATDFNNPPNIKTIGNQESTVLNLPSSLANFVTLGQAQFVNATTGEIMGHIKIEK